jgi:hypothetical protein
MIGHSLQKFVAARKKKNPAINSDPHPSLPKKNGIACSIPMPATSALSIFRNVIEKTFAASTFGNAIPSGQIEKLKFPLNDVIAKEWNPPKAGETTEAIFQIKARLLRPDSHYRDLQ